MVYDNFEAMFELEPCINKVLILRLPVHGITQQQYGSF